MKSHLADARPHRHQRFLAALTLCVFGLLFAACADPPPATQAPPNGGFIQMDEPEPDPARIEDGDLSLEVSSPLPGAVLTTPITQIKGTAEGLDTVTVNGQSSIVEGGRWALGLELGEGAHTLLVSGEGLQPLQVPIVVDLSAPQLRITSPDRGRFMVANREDRITVRGSVFDPGAGVTLVEVNGEPVSVQADGSFEHTLGPQFGVNQISIVAEDGAGRRSEALRGIIYGDFSPWGSPTDAGVQARISRTAFPVVEEALLNLLDSGIVDDLLAENIPATENIRVTSVNYGRVDIDLTPMDGHIAARTLIHDLRIGLSITQDLLVTDVTISGSVSADPAELNANIYVEPTSNGSISARLGTVEVDLNDFDLQVDGILDWLAWTVEGLVRDYAETTLVDLMNEVVLAELFDPSMLHRELNLLGRTMPFDLMLTDLDIDRGGMSLKADVDMPLEMAPGVPDSPGVLVLGSEPPGGTGSRMARMELAGDFLNKILAQAWRGGLMDLDVRELLGDGGALPIDLNAGSMALLVGRELREHADADTPVTIKLRPLLPPVATVQNDPNRTLRVEMADLLMDFYLQPEGAAPVKWATVAVALRLDIGVRLVDGSFSLDFDVAAWADLDAEPLFDMDDANVEGVVVGLLEGLPGILGSEGLDGLFDLGEIEILGVRMANAAVNAEGDHLTFEVDLVP